MHKIFGEKENQNYHDRKGAYIIPIKDNQIAVVKTNKGLFFLGGGIENNETDTQCIKRECLEECGYNVAIKEKLCSAETYTTHAKIGYFHPIQTYYLGELLDKVQEPIEKEHQLLWFDINKIIDKMYAEMHNWVLEQIKIDIKVSNDLKSYIEQNILPEYAKNDSGHNIEHINYVIDRCFHFAEQFDNINIDMLYTIACFHDIAHYIDKKNHEKLSAEIFYNNKDINQFFTDEQIIIIKEGIEDHRASSDNIPRSDYGKIISSADRSTDVNEFLKRTHAYTLKYQPNLSENEIIERAYIHTKDKYGDDGYAKSYVVDEQNNDFKNEITNLITDREKFKRRYIKVNNL